MGAGADEEFGYGGTDNNTTTTNNNSSNYYVQSPAASCSSVASLFPANYSVVSGTEYIHRHSDHELLLLPYQAHPHPAHTGRQPQLAEKEEKDEEEEEEEEDEDEKENIMNHDQQTTTSGGVGFRLSRCSSSRASMESLALLRQQDKMMNVDVVGHHSHHHNHSIPKKLDAGDNEEEDGDQNYEDDKKEYNIGWWKYFSFSTYPASYFWIFLQLSWRLLLSFTAALLVFYIATKPPPPHVSVQVGGVNEFELAEGVDSSGVSTNFLDCNISMGVVIDNKSQVFGLGILSPMLVDVYFGRLPLVFSQEAEMMGEEEGRMIIGAHGRQRIKVNAGTTGKAMYGGGRNMEDMLKSGKGVPLLLFLSFSSYYDYRFISWLFRPTFHHHARCLLLLLTSYDSNHPTHAHHNSTCSLLSS